MSWVALGSAAITAGGSMYAAKQKGKGGETVTGQPMMPDWQLDTGKQLSEWVRKFLPNFTPGEAYGGQFSAPMTGIEGRGLDELGNLMGRPATGELFGAGRQQILDTLGGRFADPNQSPFIKAMTQLSGQNLRDATDQARGRRGARGTYYTTAGLQEESRLSERTQNALNAIIGEFQNQERGRQFSAAPIAAGMDEYENLTAPLKRITASQTLGSLERTLQQADLERQYGDYKRQRDELGTLPGVAQGVYSTNVPYGLKSVTMPQQSSNFQQIMAQMAPLFSRSFGGGGQSSPSYPGAGAVNYPELYGENGPMAPGGPYAGNGGNGQFMQQMLQMLARMGMGGGG